MTDHLGMFDDLLASPSAKAIQLMLLAGTPGAAEIIGARWSEIDGDVWAVPGERTKSGNPIDRPLALEVLASLPRTSEFVFPGRSGKSGMMSNGPLQKELTECDVHGLRSVFRSWVSETAVTVREHDAVEVNLDHKIGSRVHRAYDRADHLDERRKLAIRWAEFLGA